MGRKNASTKRKASRVAAKLKRVKNGLGSELPEDACSQPIVRTGGDHQPFAGTERR